MKHYGLIAIGILPIVLLYIFFDPIAQDQAYHQFADQRYMLGIPNFHNVMSNIPFLIVAFLGLKNSQQYSLSWVVFLVGVALVGPGSAYYHWNPTDATLVWDRLPMTIGFMGLTSFILKEVFQLKWEKQLLTLLLFIGAYSIGHWVYFSDLRIYAWVQLTPILMIIYCAIFYRTKMLKPGLLAGAVVFYGLAKVVEHTDKGFFESVGFYSGHSLKHILAAVAVLFLLQLNKKEV